MSAITSRQRRANDRRRAQAEKERWRKLSRQIRKLVWADSDGDPYGTEGPDRKSVV